jgi:hypothetical protein
VRDRRWERFEDQVSELFRLKGFQATSNTIFAGRQHDVVLASDDEAQLPILVECKYHDPKGEGVVGVVDLEDFAGRVMRLRSNGDISGGYLITNTRFSAPALGAFHNRPEEKFVLLRTLSQLRRGLVNFDRYLLRLVSEYEAGALHEMYQPLKVAPLHQPSVAPADAIRSLIAFSRDSKTRLCVLTGDYGTGKTTVSRRVAYLLAKDVIASGTGRIPVLIPLKWYGQAGGAGALLQRFLDESGLRHANVDSLLAMHAAGQLVLVLDGFDEMLRRASGHARRETIADLVDLCVEGTKMILTGRPGYFADETELRSAFRGVGISGVGDRLRAMPEVKAPAQSGAWRRVELQPLDAHQIELYILSKLPGDVRSRRRRTDTLIKVIESTYNLADLARRPILLDMVIQTLGASGADGIVTPAELYATYVATWLRVDADKGAFRSLISPEDRLSFSIALAWILQDRSQQEIYWRDLQRLVGTYFQLEEADDVDHFSGDVRTSSFLGRDDNGNFRFAHLSFQEYFCARFLVEEHGDLLDLLEGILYEPNVSLADLANSSSAVLDFAGDMIGCPVNPFFWRFIRDGIAGYQERIEKASLRFHIGPKRESLDFLLQMADGDGRAFELGELAFAYTETYLGLQAVLGRMAEEREEEWLLLLVEALRRGRLSQAEIRSFGEAIA